MRLLNLGKYPSALSTSLPLPYFLPLFERSNPDTCCIQTYKVFEDLIGLGRGKHLSGLNAFYQLNTSSFKLPLSDITNSYILKALEYQSLSFQAEVICPSTNQYLITLATIPDTLSGKDFGFEITPCHHLNMQLASNQRIRCFTNTTSISYLNQGSLSAPDAYIIVEFPQWVRPIFTTNPHVVLNDSTWRFNLGTVNAGAGSTFTITDSVLCGNLGILGLTQCTKATIFPAPNCPPVGWSGAEVTLKGECNNGYANLGIYNNTSADMPDSVDYWLYIGPTEKEIII